jgi:competence protein ComEA
VEEFILKNKVALGIFLFGFLVVCLGVFALKGNFVSHDKVEVLEDTTEPQNNDFLIVEVAGAVTVSGVYKMPKDSRVEDVLIAAGGMSADADRDWVEKSLNRAAKIIDGQKIYIPRTGETKELQIKQSSGQSANNFGVYQSDALGQGSGMVNINLASQNELESLNGIGPVYAQKIIEQRPYSNIEELLSKSVIPNNTYEEIKQEITVY